MQWQWTVRIWGTRGTFPTADKRFAKYGGSTCCLSVETKDSILILDAGSGITEAAEFFKKDTRPVFLLIGHMHIDHICGLFMCRLPELSIYGPAGTADALHTLFAPPYWPVWLFEQARIHELAGGQSFFLGGFTINTLTSNHPGGGLLYRISDGQRCLSYALDQELTGVVSEGLRAFVKNSGLLIWDASYEEKAPSGWGHSSIRQGVVFARSAGAGKVVMTHYGLTDDDLDRISAGYEGRDVIFAREGMVIEL